MAHKVIIFYRLYMPYYFLGTFTEYPYVKQYITVWLRPHIHSYVTITQRHRTERIFTRSFPNDIQSIQVFRITAERTQQKQYQNNPFHKLAGIYFMQP